MKNIKSIIITTSIMTIMAITGVWAETGQTNPQQPVASQQAEGQAIFSDELEPHFRKAQEYFSKRETGKAAEEIRKEALFLKEKSRGDLGEKRRCLVNAGENLEQLADRIGQGKVTCEKDLHTTFARVHRDLAEYYHHKASESWPKKAISQVGQNLKASALHLESAWKWSGHQLETGTRAAIDNAKHLANKIVEGAGWVAGEVSKGIDDLGKEIGKIGKSNKPESSPSAIPVIPFEEIKGPPIDFTTAIIQVAKSNIPAVVHIQVTERQEIPNPLLPFENDPFFRRYFGLPKKMPKKFERELIGVGTGMIIDTEGHILTNNHVVGGATKIQVLLSDGTQYDAKVVGTDPKTDLGVIKISAKKPLPFLTFGDSDKVEVGQWVVAIGQPRGLNQSVSQGIISAKHRTGITDPTTFQDFLQTDAAINPGNSGGPLLTLRGQVIGVNSVIMSQSGGFEGIGFAIPSNMAVHVAKALITHGKVERGWLGISIQELTPELAKSFGLATPKGALIADAMKGGPADKAGIKRGDVVLVYQDKEIPDASTLRNDVANTPVGQEVKVTVWRNGKRQEIRVNVGSLEDETKRLAASLKDRLGVVVGPVTDQEAEKYGLRSLEGVMVQWVDSKGPLGQVGFEAGDIILAVNGHPIKGVESFVTMVITLPHHQKIVLLALDHRTGQTGSVQTEVP